MSIQPKPFVSVPSRLALVANKCHCIDANATVCLAGRHQVSLQLSDIFEGCTCRCHFSSPGVQISHSQWQPIINKPTRNGWKPGPSEVK